MHYFVTLTTPTTDGSTQSWSVEEAENPSEAVAQAVENLANIDYGPEPRIFYTGRNCESRPRYVIHYSPPNTLGITERLEVVAEASPCNLYRVEDRVQNPQEYWAPTPEKAAEWLVDSTLKLWGTSATLSSQLEKSWPSENPTNWIVNVIVDLKQPKDQVIEEVEVRALVPATV
jgi:hypothetical protein